jgi:FkbM family methyltransferase
MKRLTKSFLIAITGNYKMQRFLEKSVNIAQDLMGVGAGSDPLSSGEQALVRELTADMRLGRPPPCIFDVGANKGQFLELIFSGLRNIQAQIHAFEPGAAAFQMLTDKWKQRPNVTLNNVALSGSVGVADLFYEAEGSGLASLSKRRLDHFGIYFCHSEKVHTRTLDSYCAEHHIEYIDLLKLDVEGHELDVLRGGVRMFEEDRVGMLTFEFGGGNIDTRTYFQDFYYLMKEFGMNRIYRITPSGYLFPVSRYSEIYEQFRATNYLVKREG